MEIRNMRLADIDTALSIINVEGWEYSNEELERMLKLDPKGSFFCVDDEPVGVITTVSHGRTGVVGHLVVSKRARGRQVGQTLIKHAIEYLDSEGMDTILLYATQDGERLYKRYGFKSCRQAFAIKAVYSGGFDSRRPTTISSISQEDLDEIIEIDSVMFGDDRGHMLRHLHSEFPEHSYKIVHSDKVVGYAFGRSSSVARDFGPWGCTTGDKGDAEALFKTCINSLGHGPVFFGVFPENKRAMEIANTLDVMRAWPTELMTRGRERYSGNLDSVYGIIGFELG